MIAKHNIHIGAESKHGIYYYEAWLYCACYYEHGYSDWRMPTYTECAEILNSVNYYGCWEVDDSNIDYVNGHWIVPVREI